MSKNKLMKFAEMRDFPNVFQNFDPKDPKLTTAHGKTVEMSGQWAEKYLGRDARILIELACGKAEYTLALAREYPDALAIGIDIKGARMWKGSKIALEEDIDNAAFLRTRIEQIEEFFGPAEIDEVWITFPDPFPKRSDENKRLTSPNMLQRYAPILKKGAVVHLKTDASKLYEYTKEVLRNHPQFELLHTNDDIYANREEGFHLLYVKTFYEKQHLEEGRTIHYLRFRFTGELNA